MAKFFPPVITTAERNFVLDDGEIVYDEDEQTFYLGDGTTTGGVTLKGDQGDEGPPGTLTAVVEDLTPQAGGDFDLNGNAIVTTSNGDIPLNPDGTGQVLLGGDTNAQDNVMKRPAILDYGEVVNVIGSIGGGTQDLDLELGNIVSATVDTSTTTLTFSNPTVTGIACSLVIFLTNGGSQAIVWPTSVDWPGGVAPTLTVSGLDIIVLTTTTGGVTWHGMLASQDSQ